MSVKSTATSLATSLVLMLAAFPFLSLGTTFGPDFLTWLGVSLLAVGGLIPLVRRFVRRKQEPEPPDDVGMAEDVRVT